MLTGFKKRIYTPGVLAGDIWFLLTNIGGFAAAKKNEKLSRVFIEKIMSVVTAVNGCVYCSWFHAKESSSAGMSQSEIDNLFKLQFDTEADEYELPALKYAQHFAETERKPDPQEKTAFVNFYGAKTAWEIMLFIRLIFWGNLLGNTYDAFLSRLKGHPAPNSNAIFEFFFFIFAFPLLFPASLLLKKDSKKAASQ
ncbi:MAG: carboxymuconolactone decarboxylase family protein [Candidatus Cloacimonetes bacterium]|nr:carboxymuconolactone decarboxylase family protein [Candidatus Cloacimonadota bacterium]MDD3235190.1 carboxymuconolactone decarboxylase family protein [Candidatus Cloacimonadota bacterium]